MSGADMVGSYEEARALLRTPVQRAAYIALGVALLLLPWVTPTFYVGEAAYIFIMCIASLGLMTLTGFTGQVSLGQAAFLSIGAYTHAQLISHGVPLPMSLLLAGLCAGVVGLLIGLPAIRVSGLHLAIVTLAFAILTEHVMGRWTAFTGGHSGMAVPEPMLLGYSLADPRPFYYLCLAVLVVVLLLLVNLMRSATGRAFVGVRDSEAAAQGLAIRVARTKVTAFVVSAVVSGIAGALLGHQTQFITPEGFGMALSLQLVLMVFIGGMGSLRGAILGALLIGMLPSLISLLKEVLPARIGSQFGLELFVYGAVLVFFVLLEPRGLNGRWIRLRGALEQFPLLTPSSARRQKSYMRSERA
ncbi:MAG: branched-chain amino acid ABC transporter permease [Comamonadaceae bacterium]|nr:MAG: branched-chain amino acid ABC transporter permease [Comamonadaceae bacterium]